MHSRIFLIGFMGSGKTTHGQKIARMTGYEFIDMDRWITEKEGASIPEIFKVHGESHFRELETIAIKELGHRDKIVIATGGGAPCHNNNMEIMKNSGLTVYLKMNSEELYNRLVHSKNERPLLRDKTDEEMRSYIEELLKEREPCYSQADMVIDGLYQVDERIVNAIQRKANSQ